MYSSFYRRKKEKKKKEQKNKHTKELRRPGIEPEPLDHQSCILPLH